MATIVHLIRHGVHDAIDRVLVARAAFVDLSDAGVRQAQALADRFAGDKIAGVQSSPQPRARQTAQPIADRLGLAVEIVPAFDEIDMGAWTGRSFEELQHDPQWRVWNSQRENARPPGGESIRDLQHRVLTHLQRVGEQFRGRQILIVSHAEPIRTAVLHCRARSPDDFLSVRMEPASVTTIRVRGRVGDIFRSNAWIEDRVAT